MQNNNLLSTETIRKAKGIPIVDLLHSIGIEPIKAIGNELVYCSPLRTEKSGSFFVNPDKNCFNDFGGEQEMKGDSIKLAQLLWHIGFKEAVQRLTGTNYRPTPSFSFSGHSFNERGESGLQITNVRPLQHPALIQYVKQRGISLELAYIYLKEVSYITKGKTFFAVGFQNDLGGYELRNGLNFKGGKTLNAITSFDLGTESAVLFEGFFDFISALEYYGKLHPINTTIVLNTCTNINKALPLLNNRKQIHCYLDNDKTGRNTLQKLKNNGLTVKDWSSLVYPNSKDFNEYLIAYRNKEVTTKTNR
jgi:DNA primase